METAALKEVELSISASLNSYLQALSTYSEEQFAHKENEETWSLAQMYEHLTTSTTLFFLANAVRCLEERKGQMGGEPNERGKVLMEIGSMPPRKFKRPGEGVEIIEESNSIAYNETKLKEIIAQIPQVFEKIPATPSEYRCYHPFFEWLNSHEWLKNLEMHLRHHFMQQKELSGFAKV